MTPGSKDGAPSESYKAALARAEAREAERKKAPASGTRGGNGNGRNGNGNGARLFNAIETIRKQLGWLLIPLCIYVVRHEVQHRDVDSFIAAGGRVYSSNGEPISDTQLLERVQYLIDRSIEQKVPPSEVTEALVDLRGEVKELRAEIVSLGRDVTRLDERMRVIIDG